MSVTKASIVKGVVQGRFDRITVKAGEDLLAGDLVFISTVGEPPTVMKTGIAVTSVLAGVMAEDVLEDGIGVCIRANAIVEMTAGDTCTQGQMLMAYTTTVGTVTNYAKSAAQSFIIGQCMKSAIAAAKTEVALNIHTDYGGT